jgi:hypothetical protein
LDLFEPSDQGRNLTSEQSDKAMELLRNKILKNPVFAGRESEVILK